MKILVVDGDMLFTRLLRAKLERWGHTVVIEHDGTQALKRIRHEPFRMVIMDWDLRGVSGPDLCRQIRAIRRPRYTYLILFTAKTDKDSIIEGLQAGADDYLTKPLNTVELRLRIKSGKRLLNLEDELREGGGSDGSTGAVNAKAFRQFFRVTLAEARRTGTLGALLFGDVDNYDHVYGEHGYAPAEAMMRELAQLFGRLLRESDLIGRSGKNQLCLLLQNTCWDRCRPLVDKMRGHLTDISIYVDGQSFRPECSLSVVNFPQEDTAYDILLDAAPREVLDRGAGKPAPDDNRVSVRS